jgi:chondroitin AC lyase
MKQTILIFLLIVFSSGLEARELVYPQPLQQLHRNMIAYILNGKTAPDRVKQLLSEMKEDGSWGDIDYASKERGGWPPAQHIGNLLTLAKAYRTEGSGYCGEKAVSEQIHRGLNFWLKNDFQCPNWWYPEIGVPMVLAPLMLLMEPELREEEMQKGVQILDRSKIRMTGQNKVWLSGNVLMRSLLLRDEALIGQAAQSIQSELVVSTAEGVQPDWSYHQHGPQIQFGNYGLAYVGDMIKWISILRNTPFRFDETKMMILRNYLLEGLQWVTWKGRMDISACGRQLFPDSPDGKARALAGYFEKMEQLDPQFAGEYQKAGDYRYLSGNRHFWRSDYQVQRDPDYYFSVKMCSERVIGAESCNAENIQGYYMGDGATFLYEDAREYENIFPFWDWKKIPGTTTHQDNDTLPVLTARGYRIDSKFVGGVSGGKHGVAVMDYRRNGLQARKSWFLFGDVVVCLGTGIRSPEGVPVATSVDQSLFREKPEVFVQKEGTYSWMLHHHTGYFFPENDRVRFSTGPVAGAWNFVARRYPLQISKERLFKLWIDHGTNPEDETYQYILVPNADRQKLDRLGESFPFRIVNRKDRQEVWRTDGSQAGIVFYQPGKSEAFGGLAVDCPCVVLLEKADETVRVSVSDPTRQLREINLNMNGKTIPLSLPTGEQAGKTAEAVLTL